MERSFDFSFYFLKKRNSGKGTEHIMVLNFSWRGSVLFIVKMPKFGEKIYSHSSCIQSICLWVSKSREALHNSRWKWD